MTRDEVRRYLEFYQDLGIKTLFRHEGPGLAAARPVATQTAAGPGSAAEKQPAPPSSPPPAALSSIPAPADAKTGPVQAALSSSPAARQAETAPVQLPALPALEPDGDTLLKILEDIGDCKRCRLHEGRNKLVFGTGNERAQLVFVGEGPGADEDEQGVPFVGRAGQLLTQMIEGTARKEGIPLERPDVYICNVVKCRPPENRTPQPDEMEICGQFLSRQLQAIRPKAICALGSTAAKALLGTKEGVMRLRGKWHRWRDIPVMVTYHPSYLLRPYNQNAKKEAWEDLKKVLHYVYD